MKRSALIFATAAMALTSTLALAQPDGGRYGDRDGRYDNNRYNGGRNDYRGGGQRWQRGQRLDQRYRGRDRIVSDYGRYRLSPPPRGYSYYRSDTGDIVMAAIATGLISSVIAGALSGDQGYSSGYSQPYAAPAYGGPTYSEGAPVYRDASGRAYTVDEYGRSVWLDR